MCGIAGSVGGGGASETLLQRMADTMIKRGPDGQGIWTDERAGLVACRLAIIDLHERSNQPLHFGDLHLVFNGELYNYRELREELRALGHSFDTEGDAEVLLHAWAEWGEHALERFNGMFAFAIWDAGSRRLVLATDPFGEKPLLYARSGDRLVFASEFKALLHDESVPADPNDDALAQFVARSVMPLPDETFFRGIRRLPGAHVLRFERGAISVERYWRPGAVDVPPTYPEAADELRELLHDSIRLRLRSDVPVGTSLSGGIDSSTVVILAAAIAGDHRRHAFTARFPGFERDEWAHAASVAERAGVVEHHAVEPAATELLDDLEQLVLDHEEPVGSASIYAQWRVMAVAKDAGVVVLLDGQGGDELFGGYEISAGFALRAAGPRAALSELVANPSRAGVLGRSLAMDFLPRPLRRAYWRRVTTPYAAQEIASHAAAAERRREPWIQESSPLGRELLTQAFDTSLPQLLRYADRSSMAHSRELRLPFLDRRIAEFAFSLPAGFVYGNGRSKRILRDVGRGLVPDEVLDRRDKVGFLPPQARWLNEAVSRERIAEVLLDGHARARGLYDTAAVEADVGAGAWRDPDGIWRALNAELWLTLLTKPVPAAAGL
jgi:asparagine synthase (glutamine-hydrolysing)